jgi:hypothetical protein
LPARRIIFVENPFTAMKPGRKPSKKKSTKKNEDDSFEIAETKKRLKQQQEALKKIIQSFGKKKPKDTNDED